MEVNGICCGQWFSGQTGLGPELYLHGDDVPLLLGDLVVLICVLTHHPVQAAVGHLGVAGAGEVHGEDLEGDGDIRRIRTKAKLASRLK